MFPQAPQLDGSPITSVHVLPHMVLGERHCGVSHVPLLQAIPTAQAFPQAPQL
jgi:hypothetical protein